MSSIRFQLVVSLLIVMLIGSCACAEGEGWGVNSGSTTGAAVGEGVGEVEASKLWDDFMYYVQVASLKLAASSGEALLSKDVGAAELIKIISESSYHRNYENILIRGMNLKSETEAEAEAVERLSRVAGKIEARIKAANLELIRDPARIRQAIERLDDGRRANDRATVLLKEAGEYASAQLLEVLLSRRDEDKVLEPFVIEAMVMIGHPLSASLSESLGSLPVVVRQQVAQVLGRIGYTVALPYLKAQMEDEGLDDETRDVIGQAFDQIAKRVHVSREVSAAELYYDLSEKYYAGNASLILQSEADENLMWLVDGKGKLRYVLVPTEIFGDAQSMRAATAALRLDREMSKALSVWIAANFRRENSLGMGVNDPTYGSEMRSPHYYATLAGPGHVSPVLSRAIAALDSELALDAIGSLRAVVGNDAVMEGEPLLAALNYPDQRVRFEAALAIASAKPGRMFTGIGRVLPVLLSAVRQTSSVNTVVIGGDQLLTNELAGRVRLSGMEVWQGRSMSDVSDQLTNVSEVNLMVLSLPLAKVERVIVEAGQNYKLQATPIVVLAGKNELVSATRRYVDEPLVVVTKAGVSDAELGASMKQALSSASGVRIDAAQSLSYAVEALSEFRELALSSNVIFDAVQAEGALIGALSDSRDEVAVGAADVLVLVESESAQQALAKAALDASRGEELRVIFLRCLSESARRSGNLLTDRELGFLLDIVDKSRGKMADAAAEAHGALNLPTSHDVGLITR